MKKLFLLSLSVIAIALFISCSNDADGIINTQSIEASVQSDTGSPTQDVIVKEDGNLLQIPTKLDNNILGWTVICHSAWGDTAGYFVCTDGNGKYLHVIWEKGYLPHFPVSSLIHVYTYKGTWYGSMNITADMAAENCR